jgi:uncharacterized protein (DUF58 family)
MDYFPPASVRASIRPAHLAFAIAIAGMAAVCASFRENGTAILALWCSLLALGWILSATVLTHVCGVNDLQVRPPQNTADFHALSGFRLKVHLGNRGRRFPALFVTARLETSAEGIALNSPPLFVAQIGALGQVAFAWDITVRKRGEVDLRGLRVETCFPGSLTINRAHFPFSQRLLALPAIYRLDNRTLQLLMGRRRSGGRTSSAPASLEDFVGVREYRPGDNPRSIHFALSLRLAEFPNQLAVREYEDPSTEDVLVVLDTFVPDPDDAMQNYRHEKSLSFAVALCRMLTEKQYSVRFRAVDGGGAKINLQVQKPTRDLPRLEACLAKLRPARDPAAAQALLNDARARGGGAVVFIALCDESKLVSHCQTMLTIGPELQASLVREVVSA